VHNIEPQPRVVQSRPWYESLKRFGFDYGPQFQSMSSISAHPSHQLAVATVVNETQEGESNWAIHPSKLDSILQIWSVAALHGLPRNIQHLAIPTYIEELYIRPPKGPIVMRIAANDKLKRGATSGHLVAISEGVTVIEMTGLSLSRISGNGDPSGQDPHAATELQWKPDLNLMDASTLIHRTKDGTSLLSTIDRFCLACILETYQQLQGVQSGVPYLAQSYLPRLQSIIEQAKTGQYTSVAGCDMLARMDRGAGIKLIEELYAELQRTEAASVATAVYRNLRYCKDFFSGEADPLEILFADDILPRSYAFMQGSDYSKFLDLLGHRKPNMKILEIGAGTGGTTSTILPHLKSIYGEQMYFSYTYTDISASFFSAAKERFKDYEGIQYAVLDISKDVTEQISDLGSFDLVVASNVRSYSRSNIFAWLITGQVLHATSSLNEALVNVRKLLHSRGRLFLQELDPSRLMIVNDCLKL
jgi:hypothetical protein